MKFPSPKDYKFINNYTSNEIIGKYTFNGEDIVSNNKYYLSDSVEETFQVSKVGKTKNGKYIIVYDSQQEEVLVYEIQTLTSEKLVLVSLKNSSKTPFQAVEKQE